MNFSLVSQIKSYTSQFESERAPVNRESLEDLLKRRFFYTPAFEIYNGVARARACVPSDTSAVLSF